MSSQDTLRQGTHYVHCILPSTKLFYKLHTLLLNSSTINKNGEDLISIAVEHENRKRYFFDVTLDELLNLLLNLEVSKRTFYEVLCSKRTCKLYFDVDIYTENSAEMNVQESLLILQSLFHYFISDWTEERTMEQAEAADRFLVLCASTKAKHSYHVIYTDTKIRFESPRTMYQFVNMLLYHCSYFIVSHPCHRRFFDSNGINLDGNPNTYIKYLQMISVCSKFCSCIIPGTKVTCNSFCKLLFKSTFVLFITYLSNFILLFTDSKGLLQWVFDLHVYNQNQQFRLYQATKFGQDNPLLPTSDFPFNPQNQQHENVTNNVACYSSILQFSLISYAASDPIISIISYDDNRWLLTNRYENSVIDLTAKYNLQCPNTMHKSTSVNKIIQPPVATVVHAFSGRQERYDTFILKLIKETYDVNGHIQSCQKGSKNRSLLFYNIGGEFRYCERLQRHHKSNQTCVIIDTVTNNYQIKCKDPDCKDYKPPWKKLF